MKKLILSAITLIAISSSNAQNQATIGATQGTPSNVSNDMNPRGMRRDHKKMKGDFQKMKNELNLTPEQQAKLKEMREQHKMEMKTNMQKHQDQVNAILTPEQQAKMAQMRQNRKAKKADKLNKTADAMPPANK